MENVTLLAAFIAGVLSFISPCVLPLIPGYVSFVSGVTMDEFKGKGKDGGEIAVRPVRARVLMTACAFVLGFSLVFISLGATASMVGQFLGERLALLGKIAGVVIIIFGLHTMGVLRIGWLYSEKRVQTSDKPTSLVGAVLVGIAFAFGWTPCIGPILSGILAIAGTQEVLSVLKRDGSLAAVQGRLASFDERQRILRKAEYDARETRYAGPPDRTPD